MQYIIVHYDEIGLKKGNRNFFETRLVNNIKDLVKVEDVQRERGQIIVKAKRSDDLIRKLKLIPGISHFIFTKKTELDIEKIKRVSEDFFNMVNKSFRITTRRHNKGFKFKSPQINEKVGQHIKDKFKMTVKLNKPDFTLVIEICNKNAFLGWERYNGVGGMPVGSAGRLLCLLSGGIDSPVAAFMMMKRGVKVDFVHFENKTIVKKNVKIKKIVEHFEQIQGKTKLFNVEFEHIQKEIIMNVASKYRMIIYRRMMGRIAEKLAKLKRYHGLVTGDSLSQVASQTIQNVNVIYRATDMLNFSPLIGLNKREIIDIAHKIGTYDLSNIPYEDCCSFMIAKSPETRCKLEEIEEIEKKFDVDSLINNFKYS